MTLSKLHITPPPAFRYPKYRAFWFGMLVSVSGFQILRTAQFWLIFELTDSAWYLGWVGLANGIPAIGLNLVGGLAADKVDQRRLIMVAQSVSACLIFLLATITLLGMVQVWHILTIAFLAGAVEAFDQPARRAFFPYLIEREAMMSAVAMNSSIWPGTRIMAPAAAGFIISITGTAEFAFYVAGAGFLAMAIVASTLRVPRVASRSSGGAVKDLMEGLHFITKNSVFSFLIAMTFFNSFFAMAYVPLMPVFAKDILDVGPRGMGTLLGISGVGSLLTTIWFAAKGGDMRKGILIIGGGLLGGISVVAFGLTSAWFGSYSLALVLLFFVGVFSTMQNTALQSSLQVMVPDHIRGRIMGFYGMTYNIRPLGGMQAGALAGFITAPLSIAVGGLAVILFSVGAFIMSPNVRHLSDVIRKAETGIAPESPSPRSAAPAVNIGS